MFGKPWPVKAFVIALIALSTIPLVVLIAFLILNSIEDERARYHNTALQLAISAANSVDRDLQGLIATGQALTTSRMLVLKNYEEFYRQALRVREMTGVEVIYKDASGQQIVNTRQPWGSELPISLPESDRLALASKLPQVSNLFIGASAKRPIISVNIPVFDNDEVIGLVNLGVDPERFREILRELEVPDTWTTTLVGRDDRIIARSIDHEGRLGLIASEQLRREAIGSHGMYLGNTLEGTRTLSAYARSDLSAWRVLGVPISIVEAPLIAKIERLAIVGLLFLLLSAAFAVWLGTHLTRSVRGLAESARNVGESAFQPSSSSLVKEVNDVSQTLSAASEQLREREENLRSFNDRLEIQVSQRTSELVESNRKLVSEIKNREAIEDQLRQAQKMDAIGRLSGGIAHDFNNFLAVIFGSLDMIRRRIERNEYGEINRLLDSAKQGSQRAASFTQRLLAFARQQPLAPVPLNINAVVLSTSELIGHSIGKEIKIETILAAGLWLTYADPNQLEQSILNLAVNARDAMPDGGRLTIETANFYIDEKYQRENPTAETGRFVMVAVTDTGSGMTPEQIEKAFEPFYTTKPKGQGTGLGLSQVYGFVKQSGGHVKIYSEVGQGTTVRIYLPRFSGQQLGERTANETEAPPTGTETILVVEDEDALRDLTVESVRELGYRVLAAADGKSALRILEVEHVDLLFTDVVMPDMNGRKLAEEARRRHPKLAVLFTTGYTKNAIVHNGILDEGVEMIAKPFTIEDLAVKLRRVLR